MKPGVKTLEVKGLPTGTKIKGIIYRDGETSFEGRLTFEDGRYFVCQDVRDGCDAADKLGYRYSWSLRQGDVESLEHVNVKCCVTSIELDPDFVPDPVVKLNDRYSAIVQKGQVKVGNRVIPNSSIRELYSKLIN